MHQPPVNAQLELHAAIATIVFTLVALAGGVMLLGTSYTLAGLALLVLGLLGIAVSVVTVQGEQLRVRRGSRSVPVVEADAS